MIPPPYRQGYIYQGIKPAVLPVDGDSDENLMAHIRTKQEELVEKLKLKRAHSIDEDRSNDDQKLNVEDFEDEKE